MKKNRNASKNKLLTMKETEILELKSIVTEMKNLL